MANPFVHLELNTPDLDAAKRFYGELCGWKFEDMATPNGIYSTFNTDNGTGGMVSMDGRPAAWLPYIGVADIKVATDKAVELGATASMACHEIPGVGWMTMLVDPTGARVALFQPKT